MNHYRILILDFGSQYTQLIARRIRELKVYCEIIPFSKSIDWDNSIKGIILSGSPFSVNDPMAPKPDVLQYAQYVPILGICYGAQLMVQQLGGTVSKSNKREYGRAHLKIVESSDLLKNINNGSQVWMSHSDSIQQLPSNTELLAHTDNIPTAAYKITGYKNNIFGLQFHPEVYHSENGIDILKNFVFDICKTHPDWTPNAYIEETVAGLKDKIGNEKVVMALSGGVDSTVAATLIQKAIGQNLHCIFVNHGLLRKDEFNQVMDGYNKLNLQVKGVDASALFLSKLSGITDPEEKRKIIGGLFIDIFQEEASKIENVRFLGQGTIYPDVIESISVNGPSVTIKSHHNVGGLPEKMNLKLVEPLRFLFKDEVRKIGKELQLDSVFLDRHPFPGPGLGIRILGEVDEEKVRMLQEADYIYIQHLMKNGLYHKIWQAGAILLPIRSVGVMGDERTYELTVALRAVTSTDGMTADWAEIPNKVLAQISNDIINNVAGINRVVYDISSKPPATIEWE